MSRRQRRRAAAESETGKVSRWVRRGLLGLAAVLVLLLAVGWIGLRKWLHSDACRQLLGREAGRGLKAQAEFGAFRWEGSRVRTDSFRAEQGEKVERVQADGMEVDLTLSKIFNRVVRVERAHADRLLVELNLAKRESGEPVEEFEAPRPKASGGSHWYDGLVPKKAELGRLLIDESAVGVTFAEGRRVALEGMSWEVESESGGSYVGRAQGGEVRLPWKWAPVMRLKKADLRYQGEEIFLKRADFSVYDRGTLRLAGEVGLDGDFEIGGELRGVDGEEVLPEDWQKRLQGNLEADFQVWKRGGGETTVEGEVRLKDAVLTALPVLDTLAAYADTSRFRRVPLNRGEAKFRWRAGELELSDILLASDRLVRLEGTLKMDREERLDGTFELGLMPGMLGVLPGAEAVVFKPGRESLWWVSFRVFGTLDDPKEDLSQRLIEAAGLRLFELMPETGERVMKFTGQTLEELPAEVREILERPGTGRLIERGSDVIEGARDVVRGVGDILGAFGGTKEPPPPPKRRGEEEPKEEEKPGE